MQPASVDVIILKKLILIKQFYADAVQRANLHSNVNRVLSVVELDLAVEALLKVIVNYLDQTKSLSDSFPGLVDQADTALQKAGKQQLPDKRNIRYVHSVRNDAQHKAKYPTTETLSDCRTYTRDFLKTTIKAIWNIELVQLTLTDLVQHEAVRQDLIKAETALENGDYREAVMQAQIGLQRATNQVKRAFVGSLPQFIGGFIAFDSFGKPVREYEARELYRSFEHIHDTLFYVALGLDYSQYVSFSNLAGEVRFQGNGTPIVFGLEHGISEAQAETAVAYCIDTVIEIETRVGDLDKPLGRDNWF